MKPGDTSHVARGGKTVDAQDAGSSAYLDRCGRCGAERVDHQLGLEATPTEYIDSLVDIFREVRRILKPTGSLWLNIGDTWANDSKWGGTSSRKEHSPRGRRTSGVKDKDLVGIPYMLAFALRDDGWWWRDNIVWAKPNAMPESVKDRCTNAYEHVLLMTKSPRYFFDWWAIQEPSAETTMRMKRDVWAIPTEGSDFSHYATFPPALVEPCILAGTSATGNCIACGAPWERTSRASGGAIGKSWSGPEHRAAGVFRSTAATHDGSYRREETGWRPTCAHLDAAVAPAVVFDPFLGTGTTAAVAVRLGRHAAGVELNPTSCRDAERQIAAAELERSRQDGTPLRAETVSDMGPLWEGIA